MIQKINKCHVFFFACVVRGGGGGEGGGGEGGGGQDKSGWTACFPGVKITREGGQDIPGQLATWG